MFSVVVGVSGLFIGIRCSVCVRSQQDHARVIVAGCASIVIDVPHVCGCLLWFVQISVAVVLLLGRHRSCYRPSFMSASSDRIRFPILFNLVSRRRFTKLLLVVRIVAVLMLHLFFCWITHMWSRVSSVCCGLERICSQAAVTLFLVLCHIATLS